MYEVFPSIHIPRLAKTLEARCESSFRPRTSESSSCEHMSDHLMAPRVSFLAALVEPASSRSFRRPFSVTKNFQLGEQTGSRFHLRTPSVIPWSSPKLYRLPTARWAQPVSTVYATRKTRHRDKVGENFCAEGKTPGVGRGIPRIYPEE